MLHLFSRKLATTDKPVCLTPRQLELIFSDVSGDKATELISLSLKTTNKERITRHLREWDKITHYIIMKYDFLERPSLQEVAQRCNQYLNKQKRDEMMEFVSVIGKIHISGPSGFINVFCVYRSRIF